MTAVIRWEEPPPDRRGRQQPAIDHGSVATELRERAGEWACVAIAVQSGMATAIETGRIAAYRPRGSFEARRRVVDGLPLIYARFVGEAS